MSNKKLRRAVRKLISMIGDVLFAVVFAGVVSVILYILWLFSDIK